MTLAGPSFQVGDGYEVKTVCVTFFADLKFELFALLKKNVHISVCAPFCQLYPCCFSSFTLHANHLSSHLRLRMPPIKVPRYLQPDFDPLRIKMDTIREILISHNIRAPTGAVKKQELIDLFEQHIRPQAPALRKYYETIVPSEKDIIKVPRSSMTTLAFGHSEPEATSSTASTGRTVSAAPERRSTERNQRSNDLTPSQSVQSKAVGKHVRCDRIDATRSPSFPTFGIDSCGLRLLLS